MTTSLDLPDEAPLTTIIAAIRAALDDGEDVIELVAADPDRSPGCYCGERRHAGGSAWIHRSFRTWVDLAERLQLRLSTPRPDGPGRVRLVLTRLDPSAPGVTRSAADPTEKYGAGSEYQRICKLEDPGFVIDLADALERVTLPPKPTILDLGVNTGDELALLVALRPELSEARFIGIDHCASALAVARSRFDAPRHRFIEADLAVLPQLDLPPADLALSIGTLHSPGVDDRALLRHLVQRRLTPRASLVLGIPNCSYLDGEVLYGATMRNYSQPDLSLLVKNAAFYRRYLQQHRRKVYLTGKHYLLVTAVPTGPSSHPSA